MSLEPNRKSHATAWIVTILAVLLLYVLSYGPLLVLMHNGTIPPAAHKWLDGFYSPVRWLYVYTPLGEPLRAYTIWWGKVLAKP